MGKHVAEQKLIDFTLGQLNELESNVVKLHMEQCPRCHERMNHWAKIVSVETNLATFTLDKKEDVWKKIQQNIEGKKKRQSNMFLKLCSVAASAVLLIGLANLYSINNKLTMEDLQEQPATTFLENPDTRQFNIVPISQRDNINGGIWINNVTKELLIEINGLANLESQDHQLWIIYKNEDMQGAIIPTKNGSSKMYMQGMDINEFKMIKASVEPKGGSLYPTGPETFLVEIKD